MDKFPHLNDTVFPDVDSVNVWKYKNDFDYSKYDKTQMTIGICSVPWDVGLIHVGNAQIGGLGNVVYFASKANRDAYIDSRDGFRWDTKYRAYHSDGYIEVPLPYDKCVLYNYIYCEYTLLPVEYAEGGKDRFFFFIRECEYLSPNATKIHILRDTWQTFIYDIDVSYMMLERGHAPMGLVSADRYLSNPVDNTRYLLADDVNYGDATVNRYSAAQILNDGDMWAVIVSSVDYSDNPGDKQSDTWHVPEQGTVYADGQPSSFAFAIEPGSLSRFLDLINTNAPQLTQCIKAVFFVEKALVETIESFRFLGFTLQRLAGKESDLPVIELAKSQFGYGERYADIAKLYTMPYAHLEITDENGNVSIVKIEDTQGNLSLQLTTSVAYPWLSLDGHLSGIGKGSGSVVFKNVTSHSFDFEGSWYDHLHRWEIPTFAVQQSAQANYDFATHFDRQQRNAEIETVYANAVRSADAAKASADASDNTAYGNAVRSADAAKANADASDNAAYQNAANSANATRDNALKSASVERDNANDSATATHENATDLASTVQTNADNSAATAQTNADNSASTAATNSYESAGAVNNNELASADTAYGIATRDAQTVWYQFEREREIAERILYLETEFDYAGQGLTYAGHVGDAAWLAVSKIGDDYDADWLYQQMLAGSTLYGNVVSSVLNSVSGTVSSVAGGAAAGLVAGPGGAGIGAVSGLIGSTVSLASTSAGIPLMQYTNQAQLEQANRAGQSKTNNAIIYTQNSALLEKTHMQNVFGYQENGLRAAASNNKEAANQDAENNRDTSKNNSNRTKRASDDNTRRSYSTSIENNLRTYNTETDNNSETWKTSVGNADRSFETATGNASRTYGKDVENANRSFNAASGNARRTRTTGLDNNARANTAAKTNANQTRITELANNARANTTAKDNANRTRVTGLDNNARANTAAKTNADQTRITGLANNERANTTAKANAGATRATALDGIERDIRQAALQAPLTFGEHSGGETAATRPIGIFCNIVTQSQDAIEQAGDYFLRFGYAVNRAWEFETFNIMPKFTYWKASDVWISGNNVPDAYLDEIRFYLLGGVCVWRNPDDIGRISIYENV